MAKQVGGIVLNVLERAGIRFLKPTSPDEFELFMLHVGGGGSLRAYAPRSSYWRQVQVLMDTFFSAAQRAEICDALLEEAGIEHRLEALDFAASALAERRLQDMLTAPGSVLMVR